MNKKEKIIEMYKAGKKPNEIARELETYYGYVSTTIKTYKLQEQVKNLSK